MKTSLDVIPESFFLDSPFPNPFNPKITFQFYVPNKEFISIPVLKEACIESEENTERGVCRVRREY